MTQFLLYEIWDVAGKLLKVHGSFLYRKNNSLGFYSILEAGFTKLHSAEWLRQIFEIKVISLRQCFLSH